MRHKGNLLIQFNTIYEYLDEHYEEISLEQARELYAIITKVWYILERRKGSR